MNRGVLLPVAAYPLFENALRAANGWSLDEHAARIGALWSRFSEVAAANPNAWIRPPRTAQEIVTPSPQQPNDLVSLHEALHRQHASGPGRGLHRLLRGGGPGRRQFPRTAGSSRCRGGRQRPLVHLEPGRAAPLSRHSPGRRRRHSRARVWASTTSPSSTSTPASRRSCRWPPASSGYASTTRTGR